MPDQQLYETTMEKCKPSVDLKMQMAFGLSAISLKAMQITWQEIEQTL